MHGYKILCRAGCKHLFLFSKNYFYCLFVCLFSGYTHKNGYQRTVSVGKGQMSALKRELEGKLKPLHPIGWSGQKPTSKGDFLVDETENEAVTMVSGPP